MPSSRRAARAIRPAALALAAVVAVVVAVGCTPGASSDSEEPDGPAVDDQPTVTVTIPPSRLTPFCQAMIDLNDRLEVDPPDDVAAEIVETYESIIDEVPDAIRPDFDAVLADLRGETPSTSEQSTTTVATGDPPSSDPLADEGRSPGDTPTERLSAYVDFACRSVENNPGPPPTQPLSDVTTTEA